MSTIETLFLGNGEVETRPRLLIVADENLRSWFHESRQFVDNYPSAQVLTNRFDVSLLASSKGFNSTFNDFNFDAYLDAGHRFDIIIYRISKERPLCHHILKGIRQSLDDNGQCIIFGRKNEGIKTYHKQCSQYLGFAGKLIKHGEWYVSKMCLEAGVNTDLPSLDDKDYPSLRQHRVNDLSYWTKPGVYGWDKEDKGSKLLIESLDEKFSRIFNVSERKSSFKVLDLGCGYGYLSILFIKVFFRHHGKPEFLHLDATDNNAAAILACTKNLTELNLLEVRPILFKVTADDCGRHLEKGYDLILCNPPFHQGFDSEKSLTERFVHSARRLLTNNGYAIFVVNRFIPLERLAQPMFSTVERIAETKEFFVFACAE